MPNKTIVVISVAVGLLLTFAGDVRAAEKSSLTPPSEVQAYTYHNKGNLSTIFTNWGLIGGFSGYADIPNGEWPKNSGHSYLAEIKYWMGAVTEDGDTVVVNTDDDLNPIPSLVSGSSFYGIRLSTDDTTYDFDVSDTLGAGMGYPGYGWRVYDPVENEWVYNEIYNPATGEFFQGGAIAQQESHYRMTDDALGSSQLGIEITHTGYQWNYSYNQDFIFFVLQITNKSDNDYNNFAFGLYSDFDVGGWNSAGENGRLGDLVAYDAERNLAWTYDEDGYDEGWDAETGVMGTKYIETPDGIGMTSFRTGRWEELPETDAGRFELIASAQFDESLPPTDQYYIQCTRGINLEAGKTVRVVYALVAAPDSVQLKVNADLAQMMYDNYFTGPEPPKAAVLKAQPDDGLVRLWWDNSSETTPDRFSGEVDFKGYRLYRSTDFGLTWGDLTRNPDSSRGPGYTPLAEFEKQDENDIVHHTYVDSNVTNGFEYWYSLVSYDTGDMELSLGSLATAYGTPGDDSNAVSAVPRSKPAGYYPIEKTLEHTAIDGGRLSDATVTVTEFDPALMTDDEYEIRFSEDPYYTYWHLLNAVTGDTLLSHQTDQSGSEESAVVTDGFRVVIDDADFMPRGTYQSQFVSSSDTTLRAGYGPRPVNTMAGYPLGGGMHFRTDYEIRFTQTGSQGYWWWDDVTPVDLPFEVWNLSTGKQVVVEIVDYKQDGEWTPYDPSDGTVDGIVIVNIEYDGSPHPEGFPYFHTWYFEFDPDLRDQWGPGDVFTISGAPINSVHDVFSFEGPGVDFRTASSSLDDIKVVPNPYVVSAAWEHTAGESKLEFTNLPDRCTVRIYTLAGDLVRTLEHADNGGTASWDVLSSNSQGIAPGIYFYHVDSEYGTKIGKFAIIK